MTRRRSTNSTKDKGGVAGSGAERKPFDPCETLTQWRIDALKKQPDSNELKPRPAGNWPDEGSRRAGRSIVGKGIRLPWYYADEFGENDFKVTGLRAGGTGVVYLVEFSGRGSRRLYAAKTLHSFLKPDYLELPPPLQEKISRSFLEETLPWLEMGRHPHIVSVHLLKSIVHPEFKRNIPFIFSEFIQGGNLKGYLSRKGKLSVQETLKLGIQLCDGLLHAYHHGLEAHQDIKPENIMVHDDGVYKIIDFGANVVGTPGYMAPEQVAALWRRRGAEITPGPDPIDHRADQFALGLVMLESCLGHHPFSICLEAPRIREKAKLFLSSGAGRIEGVATRGILRKILARALSANPDDRYPDLAALRAEFVAVYEREQVTYESPEVATDDSAEWWYCRGEAFLALGRYALAEAPFEAALERYDRMSNTDFDRARCMMNLGMVYRETGRLPEAEKAGKNALGRFSRISGSEMEQTRCIMNLGILHYYTGRYPEAEKDFEKALRILRRIPETELRQASCALNMGMVYNDTGRSVEAERVYRESLRIYRTIPGTEIEQARCNLNLGVTFTITRRYLEAEKAYKKSLDLYGRIPGNEIEVGMCKMNLGAVYHETGRYPEAEGLLDEAMTIYYSTPKTERDQATCLSLLAGVYHDTGRYQEAEEVLDGVLKIYQGLPGTDLDRAACMESLGNTYRETGHADQAEKAYLDALEVYRDFPGTELMRGRCMSELARHFQRINDSSRAREMADRAMKLCKQFPEESAGKIRANCRKILE